MITEVIVKNYRSIIDATVKLAPFTLLIGANEDDPLGELWYSGLLGGVPKRDAAGVLENA